MFEEVESPPCTFVGAGARGLAGEVEARLECAGEIVDAVLLSADEGGATISSGAPATGDVDEVPVKGSGVGGASLPAPPPPPPPALPVKPPTAPARGGNWRPSPSSQSIENGSSSAVRTRVCMSSVGV